MSKSFILVAAAVAASTSNVMATCPTTVPNDCASQKDGYCWFESYQTCLPGWTEVHCAGKEWCKTGSSGDAPAPCITTVTVTSTNYVTTSVTGTASGTTTSTSSETTTSTSSETTTSLYTAVNPAPAPTEGADLNILINSRERALTYLTSWGITDTAPNDIKASKANGYLLSFGQWDATGKLTFSEDIVGIPKYNPWYQQPSYITWTNLAFTNPSAHMLVAFGGQTYETIWSYMVTDEQRQTLANNLVDLLNTNFPVYKKGATAAEVIHCVTDYTGDHSCNYNDYQLIGYVQLAGLDFDFEKAARISEQENRNLEDLIKKIRAKIGHGKKVLSLTTYHVGADPALCSDPSVFEVNGNKCSYIEPSGRSTHHGEVHSLLVNTKNDFDFFNVMTYDAGRNFLYKEALKNFGDAVGDRSKIVLGNTINLQWGPDEADGRKGSFVESRSNNLERCKWQRENGFGGFFSWTLGASTEELSFAGQVDYFNDMVEASKY